ncbi:alpha/beta hydrolase [Hahella sp. CCB-MM4]|uniref:alpha/beta family hydrolase n=1 Tax=Hahella sp. (strain CCB-MM4) TaxID=1926491 RepID=UPI000B9BEC22|nr:alpha/beta family hydrolase [Hahella sp. CCB-MM4]OZG73731.1 alpha/beta hydrolase [Hahella sp. CCB-MM4]
MTYIYNGSRKAPNILLLAHGAGAPMDSEFMDHMAAVIAGDDISVVRFEFPYMAKRREDGRKRPPDRQPKLLESFMAAVSACDSRARVFVGGKSMGGRMASLLVDEFGRDISNLSGWCALGYPFHPPGKPENLRTEHLGRLKAPGLIIQGSRDPFGNQEEGVEKHLGANIRISWAMDGNHDLAPRKSSGVTTEENWNNAAREIREFILGA